MNLKMENAIDNGGTGTKERTSVTRSMMSCSGDGNIKAKTGAYLIS